MPCHLAYLSTHGQIAVIMIPIKTNNNNAAITLKIITTIIIIDSDHVNHNKQLTA